MSNQTLRLDDYAAKEIRKALIQRREDLSLAQIDVAKRMGRTQSYLSYLETGGIHNPRLVIYVAWAKALDYAIDMTFVEIQ